MRAVRLPRSPASMGCFCPVPPSKAAALLSIIARLCGMLPRFRRWFAIGRLRVHRQGQRGALSLPSTLLLCKGVASHRSGVGRGAGVGRGLGVGVGLGMAVGVTVGVAVGVGVGVTVGIGVAVAVGVGVGVTIGV